MGANADVEEKAAGESLATDNENGNVNSPPNGFDGEKEEEPSFDVGFKPWLQVFGSFFCFFNSW